jgi:uncharacterized protein YciI
MPKDQVDNIMQGHLANIERLAKEEKLLVAGPFEGGGGIFILNTTSVEEARQWLHSDPGIQANRWNIEILPYTANKNRVCIAKEPYEMVMYTFIRFTAHSNSTGQNVFEILNQHRQHIDEFTDSDNFVTDGILENNGNILILKEDVPDSTFDSDPLIGSGKLSMQKKKLWIAKGSFCER